MEIRTFQEEGPARAKAQWCALSDMVALELVFSFVAALKILITELVMCHVFYMCDVISFYEARSPCLPVV